MSDFGDVCAENELNMHQNKVDFQFNYGRTCSAMSTYTRSKRNESRQELINVKLPQIAMTKEADSSQPFNHGDYLN
jgi:hypothetical protein